MDFALKFADCWGAEEIDLCEQDFHDISFHFYRQNKRMILKISKPESNADCSKLVTSVLFSPGLRFQLTSRMKDLGFTE